MAGVGKNDSSDDHLSLCLMALAAALHSQQQHSYGAPPSAPPASSSSSSSPDQLRFRCALCDKAFASYQALGGHKASHRKPQTPATAAAAREAKPPPSRERRSDAWSSSASASASGRHVCTVCSRGFATGQALGGHKRFHYLHGSSVPCAWSSRLGAGFDLNVEPVEPAEIAGVVRRRGDDEEETQSHHAKKPRPALPTNSEGRVQSPA